MTIVADTKWKMNERSSNPRRGIRDYDRQVTFSAEMTADDISAAIDNIFKNDNPGYCLMSTRLMNTLEDGSKVYALKTTMDSSD